MLNKLLELKMLNVLDKKKVEEAMKMAMDLPVEVDKETFICFGAYIDKRDIDYNGEAVMEAAAIAAAMYNKMKDDEDLTPHLIKEVVTNTSKDLGVSKNNSQSIVELLQATLPSKRVVMENINLMGDQLSLAKRLLGI